MESALLAAHSTMSLTTLSKSLKSNWMPLLCHSQLRLSTTPASHILLLSRLTRAGFGSGYSGKSLRSGDVRPVRWELRSVSSSAPSFSAGDGGNGGFIGNDSGGGGGGGAPEGGKENPSVIAAAGEEAHGLSSEVIILDVRGMTCGGCAASVKRILESQPHVSSASVNLTTETAIIWPVSEAKAVPNWQKQLGEKLADHLTSCGFESNFRGEGATEGETPS
ncbi:unnamed protein product [Cuscuta europaea]|uniref:HMA domain-containing protein n=1 Tax=Cuscuta europaea TaxID=41803 RepID=A0A9P0ZZJ5_CUSEU|nr:unnamed protein product [Cuscuta europaea]